MNRCRPSVDLTILLIEPTCGRNGVSERVTVFRNGEKIARETGRGPCDPAVVRGLPRKAG